MPIFFFSSLPILCPSFVLVGNKRLVFGRKRIWSARQITRSNTCAEANKPLDVYQNKKNGEKQMNTGQRFLPGSGHTNTTYFFWTRFFFLGMHLSHKPIPPPSCRKPLSNPPPSLFQVSVTFLTISIRSAQGPFHSHQHWKVFLYIQQPWGGLMGHSTAKRPPFQPSSFFSLPFLLYSQTKKRYPPRV